MGGFYFYRVTWSNLPESPGNAEVYLIKLKTFARTVIFFGPGRCFPPRPFRIFKNSLITQESHLLSLNNYDSRETFGPLSRRVRFHPFSLLLRLDKVLNPDGYYGLFPFIVRQPIR